jgi:hypothetical protein
MTRNGLIFFRIFKEIFDDFVALPVFSDTGKAGIVGVVDTGKKFLIGVKDTGK